MLRRAASWWAGFRCLRTDRERDDQACTAAQGRKRHLIVLTVSTMKRKGYPPQTNFVPQLLVMALGIEGSVTPGGGQSYGPREAARIMVPCRCLLDPRAHCASHCVSRRRC